MPTRPCALLARPAARCAAMFCILVASVLSFTPSAAAQYCAASSAACSLANADEYIARVVFNTINSNSGGGSCYTDFTVISTTVFPGSAYLLTVTNGADNNGVGYAGDQVAAWIDWNHDGTFGDATSNEQYLLTPSDDRLTFAALIPIPTGTMLGATRMRIRVQYVGAISPCGTTDFGEVEDYTINVAAPTTGACCDLSGACTATTQAACTGSYQGIGTGCTASNPCGGACCNASGACTVTIATACTGTSVFGNHGVCTPSSCQFCTAGSGNCGADNLDERISHVMIAMIDNDSGPGDGPAGCYSDFTTVTTPLLIGNTYTIAVTNANGYPEDTAAVWIDWNHDFILDTSSGSTEQVLLQSDGSGATFMGSITVPNDALPGAARMRVRLTFDEPPFPCGQSLYGEVEDYTVLITGTGTCCVNTACSAATLTSCVGGIYTDGGSCSPNPCLPPGVCCRGSTCNINVTSAALCTASVNGTLAGAAFAATAFSCNAPASTSSPCCLPDYNKVNGVGIQDIFDFLNDWFMGSRFAVFHGDGQHGSPAVQNIFDFLNAWFAGC